MARASFHLLSRGLPPLIIGAVTVGLAWPSSWTAYPLGLVSLFLAISISFTLRFLVNLIAFWTLDVRGFVGLFFFVVGPLSGLFVPVRFFPEWLRVVAYATPFPSVLQTPIDVLSGWVVGWAAATLVASQLAWLVGSHRPCQVGAAASRPPAGGAGWLSRLPRRPIASLSAPGFAASWPIGPAFG